MVRPFSLQRKNHTSQNTTQITYHLFSKQEWSHICFCLQYFSHQVYTLSCTTTGQTNLQRNKGAFKCNQTQDTSDSSEYLRCPPKAAALTGAVRRPRQRSPRRAGRRAQLDSTTRGPPGRRCRPQARPESEGRHLTAAAAASLPPTSAKATCESHGRQSTALLHHPGTKANSLPPLPPLAPR